MKLYKNLILIFFLKTIFSFSQAEIKNQTITDTTAEIKSNLKKIAELYEKYNYKKALQLSNKSIKESIRIKNDTLLGWSYLMKGIVDSYLEHHTEALTSQRNALIVFKKLKNYRGISATYNNIAFAYSNNESFKNLDSAIVYYKKALTLSDNLKKHNQSAFYSVNLSEAYIELNNLKSANFYLKKAISIAKDNDQITLSDAYYYSALSHNKENKITQSLELLNSSLKIAEKENYDELLIKLYKLKGLVLRKMGDIKSAYASLKKHEQFLKKDHEIKKSTLLQKVAIKFDIKEKKSLLMSVKLENETKKMKLKKTRQIILLISFLIVISITVSSLLYRNNLLKKENNKLLTIKNTKLKVLQDETELQSLKIQIQPNFFFKTLEVLQTLIAKKTEEAQDMIIKISELMQYNIYESTKERVSIWDEIENIKNYIKINNLYNDYLLFEVNLQSNLNHVIVPPLLYFYLVEEYLKNINFNQNKRLIITIKSLNEKKILFNLKSNLSIKNTTFLTNKNQIKTINKRLKLLYKDNYSLDISIKKEKLTIYLTTPYELKIN